MLKFTGNFISIVQIPLINHSNQTIMTIETNEENLNSAKIALRKAGMKIPSPCKIHINNN